MTIEKLEALERAATADWWKVYRTEVDLEGGLRDRFDIVTLTGKRICTMMCDTHYECEWNSATIAAARNALGPLLAVARAAKAFGNATFDGVDFNEYVKTREELRAALAQLEATPCATTTMKR